jgi:hypothetical protein
LLLPTPGCFSLGSTVWVESSQQNSEGVREEISPATLEFLSQGLWEFLLKSQPLCSQRSAIHIHSKRACYGSHAD